MVGLSSARNYGLERASGDYVLFVDGDDFLSVNCVEILIKNLLKVQYDILCFNYFIHENNQDYKENAVNRYCEIKEDKKYILSQLTAWSRIYKTSFLRENKLLFKEGIIYEDLALIPTLINYTEDIGYIEDYLYYYVIRENSIMNIKKFNLNRDDKFISLETLENDFEKNGTLKRYKNEIEFLYIKHLLTSYTMEVLKYKGNIYEDRIKKAFRVMKQKYPKWSKNKYYKIDSRSNRIYLFFLKNNMFQLGKFFNHLVQKRAKSKKICIK